MIGISAVTGFSPLINNRAILLRRGCQDKIGFRVFQFRICDLWFRIEKIDRMTSGFGISYKNKKANIECRISKEGILPVVSFCVERSIFIIQKTERSDSILRNSAVGYSAVLRFAVQPRRWPPERPVSPKKRLRPSRVSYKTREMLLLKPDTWNPKPWNTIAL